MKVLRNLLVMLTAGILVASCNKKFDEPPTFVDPNIQANISIKDLKQLAVIGQINKITQDLVISGIVVADDRSGNFYKSIAIQDETGGITVRLDGTNLYTQYPVGRRIFIKLKDLYIGDYARLIQIGGGIDNSDPARPDLMPLAPGLFDTYIVKGRTGNAVAPRVVTVAQLADSLQSMLIQLNNMEFQPSDTSATYADPVTRASRNLTVRNCSGNSIIIRSSGYSNFAGVNVPNGNGTLLAIYTVFNNTKQLVIRDTSDVRFAGPRCGAGPTTQMNIADVRALFTGTAVNVPDGRRISGVVISDRTTSNLVDQNLVLQQGNGQAGIVVRFDAAHNFNLGDSLDINISQQQLSEFNGLLQVNVPLSYASLHATGKSITPRVATAKQVVDSAERWESTLVRINNATLTGGTGGNYSGTVNISDGSGTSLAMFTRTQATFSAQAYPANAASVTGYVGQFNTTYQLSIRGTSDVVAGTGGGGGGTGTGLLLTTSPYVQNFDNLAAGLPQGVFVKVGAAANVLGPQDATIFNGSLATGTAWNQTSLGVKNFASATGLTAASDAAAQNASANRALGFRQTGTTTTGGDSGVAFVFLLDNTLGKNNFNLSFLLQSLDPTTPAGRTTTWTVDYGIGDNPAVFTTIPTTPSTLTTALGTFASTNVTATLPAAINNQNQKVWIRIVTLVRTTGSGSRASSAIDDFRLTWN